MSSSNITTGQDSFLDIVANLVGVLIILVVVVGAQAQSVWTDDAVDPHHVEAVETLTGQVAEATTVAEKLHADKQLMELQVKQELAAVDSLQSQRQDMLRQLLVVRNDIEKQKALLDDRTQTQLAYKARLAELENQLQEFNEELNAVSADAKPKQEIIEHFPTPIAKTVFSEEIHFRLKGDRLVFVPLDELLGQMKAEWEVKAEKLKQLKRTIETVPEIAGFRMQYELESLTETQNTEFGRLSRDVIQFRQFVIIPTRSDLGEKTEMALRENSEFYSRLRGKTPRNTTASIWVYPDSYGSFNEVKKWLHSRGFQAAAWPLAEGSLISGSPNGFRSSAQ